MSEQLLRLFVSSPADVMPERQRVGLVVERLNAEFAGRARIETVRWETEYYSAHDTFQKQIPESADCDVVVAIFRARLGTILPEAFPRQMTGEPYPSGTAYEVLSAIEARKSGRELPDIYVFRHPNAPSVPLDKPDRAEIEAQWARLKGFFDTWFRSRSGEFLAAFQKYTSIDDFAEQVEDCLRRFLARRGFLAQGPVWDRVLRGSPFPGLAAFEADRGSVFFGRDLAVAQSVERLRQAGAAGGDRLPFLLAIGASGVGKSSMLRAGLLPRLTLPGSVPEIDLWRVAIMTPDPDPFLSLAESLFADAALGPELREGAFVESGLLARQLSAEPALALAPLHAALASAAEQRRRAAHFDAPRPARLALAIDQAERLFIEADPAVATGFAALLAALVRHGLAYVVFVLRSDAYARFQSMEALVALREAGAIFDLVPPSAGELEEIVLRPVAACDPKLGFEQRGGRSLATHLVGEAKGGDALPLLQMTLSRLYAAEAARGDGMLRFADYHGMDEAVTETANEALALVSAEARAELPGLVAGLVADVTIDPVTRAPIPIIAALDRRQFETGSPARRALIDAFVGKHLLTSEGDGVSERVRPTHEALLRIWPEAVALVVEFGHLIRIRHTLEPIVREWAEAPEGGKSHHLEISSGLLAGAQQLSARFEADLPPAMRDFIAASSAAATARADRERAEQDRRLRDAEALATANRRIARRTGIGLVGALILAGVAAWQWRTARVEEREAQAQRDRAEHTISLATDAANSLVYDLAQKFRNTVGMPAATIKDILDKAGKLQEGLLGGGETNPGLRRSRAEGLGEMVGTLLALGQTDQALDAGKRARDIFLELVKEQPASTDFQLELSISYDRIGDVLIVQGNLAEALGSYQAASTIRDHLAQSDPGNAVWQRGLSVSYEKIGDVQIRQGNLPEALKSYQAELAIADRLAKSDPGNAGLQRDLSVSYERIGKIQVAQGNRAEALKSYQTEFSIINQLAQSDLGNADWQRVLSVSHERIGDVQLAQGNPAEALKSYQARMAIADRLAQSDPSNAGWQHDLSLSYGRLATAFREVGQPTKAREALAVGRAIIAPLVAKFPDRAEWKNDLAVFDEEIAAGGK
jgi:tetratricopeptide (TPR) repeat protein